MCTKGAESAECKQCVETHGKDCKDTFHKCSGFSKPDHAPMAPGECANDQDMKLELSLEKDVPACMKQTQTAEGIAACIAKDGFTAGCSKCVGVYGKCVLDNCIKECETGPETDACKKCYETKCLPAFMTCSGYPVPKLGYSKSYSHTSSFSKTSTESYSSTYTSDGKNSKKTTKTSNEEVITKKSETTTTEVNGPGEAPGFGQCTSSSDKKLWEQRLYRDIPACMKKTYFTEGTKAINSAEGPEIFRSGVVQCIETDGFSLGCSQCVGDYAQAIEMHCSQQCNASGWDDACDKCIAEKAWPDFLKCSGFKPHAFENKCKSPQLPKKLFKFCMAVAKSASDLAACFEKTDGYTAGCADCFGFYAEATKESCGDACNNGYVDKCLKCLKGECEGFNKCTGYKLDCDKPPAQPVDQCTSAQDMKIGMQLIKDIPECMKKTQTITGISQCIKKDGFSGGCAFCVGEYGVSILRECPTECSKGYPGSGDVCKKCIETKALPGFLKCSGYWDHHPKVNECTSASDMKLWEQRLYKDMPACMKTAKDALGITVCIAADGFSAGCAECVGEYGVSIMKNCPTECKNGLDDACFECIGKKSLPAFLKCSGYPVPKPFENQCLSEEDTKNAEARLKKDMPECMKKTQTIEGIADCIKADGFSTGCSYCVGEYGFSMLKECPTECSKGYPGSGDVCKKCIEAKALPEFLKCSGYDTLKVKDQCTGAADMKNWEDRLIKDMPTCMENTKSTPDLIACFEKDGFSAGCSQCVGDYAMSIAKNCPTECHNGWNATCQACVEGKSLPAFLSCSGYKPKDLMPKTAGKCTSPEDSKLWESRLEKDMPLCMKQTQTAKGIAACIEKDGFSAGCSECVGNYGMNITMKCGNECMNGYDATCKSCIGDKCVPDFLACSGYEPKDLRPKQDKLVARMARTE